MVTNSPTYGTLQASLLASCERWAIGLAIGVTAGVLLAIVTGLSRVGEGIADPILQALRSIPLLGLIPLFIVWFGIGELPKILFVVLSALFPIYLAMFAGIRGVDNKLGELGHVLGLSRAEMIRHIVLPGALPSALTGLQLSVVSSLLALVVGEQINATSGLGFMITQAQQFLNNSVIMVALIVYGILGLLANGAVRLLQQEGTGVAPRLRAIKEHSAERSGVRPPESRACPGPARVRRRCFGPGRLGPGAEPRLWRPDRARRAGPGHRTR